MNETFVHYIFDCPLHGHESQVVCFRAFDPELKHRWLKFEATRKQLKFTIGELDKFIEQSKQPATNI